MSCHFWQFYEAAISGNFTKLPFLATSQSCLFWQLHEAAIFGNFTKLPFLATSRSCHFLQLHQTAISDNCTKLPFLATSQSCHFWQLHKAAICGNYNCCHIWQQLSAHFGKSLEVIIFHILAIIGMPSCFKICLSQTTFQNWHKFPCPFIATF